jgi:chromosomal replication initiator protein
MNTSKFELAKARLIDMRAAYSELIYTAERLEQSLESLAMEVLQITQNPEVTEIVRQVAIEFEIPISVLLSSARCAKVAQARHVAMLICREQTKLSFQELALEFRRHHSGVKHGVMTAQEYVATDSECRARYQRLTNAVRHAA